MIVSHYGRRPARSAGIGLLPGFLLALFLSLFSGASTAPGQTLSLLSAPPGYDAGSIELGAVFGGAMGVDPTDPDVIYVSMAEFTDVRLARVLLSTGTVTTVAAGPFGGIGGIAPLSATELVLIENGAAAGGPPDETILIARDNNPQDGDFDDPGEITELLTPIVTGMDFSGAQARLVPPGNPSGIPSGSVMYQSADGNGLAGLYVITDPLGTPDYRPLGGAYFDGFDFNGGFDFTAEGHIIAGTFSLMTFAAEIFGLVNTNADEDIDPGEFNLMNPGEAGAADLVIDAENDVFLAGSNAFFQASVRTFRASADPLSQSAALTDFAVTDGGFLSGVLLNSRTLSFEPESGPGGATLLMGGLTASFEFATNLLTLTPSLLQPSPTPAPSATASPSSTPAPSATASPSSTPSPDPSASPTPGPSPTPGTPTATPSPTILPTTSRTPEATITPSPTATASVTPSPSVMPTGTLGLTSPPSPTPSAPPTATPSATASPSPMPTNTGSPQITPTPSRTPTRTPTPTSTPSPTSTFCGTPYPTPAPIYPFHMATNVPLDVVLTWWPGTCTDYAVRLDVGMTATTVVCTGAVNSCDPPGDLQPFTTYAWRFNPGSCPPCGTAGSSGTTLVFTTGGPLATPTVSRTPTPSPTPLPCGLGPDVPLRSLENPVPGANDSFGGAVALSGSLALVGASLDDAGASNAGTAYLFDADSGTLLHTLNNPLPTASDNLGAAVALDDGRALVGVPNDDVGATNAGGAYIFDAATGALLLTLSNPSPAFSDTLGSSVALSGGMALLGAPGDDTGASDAGSAYLFDAVSGALLRTINNPAPALSDRFGESVALAGGMALIGAALDDAGAPNSGSAYLFDAGTGALLQTFSNPAPQSGDFFGRSVALSGSLALIGAPGDQNGAFDAGIAYLFDTAGGGLLHTFPNPHPAASDEFGSACALDGGLALVTAWLDNTPAQDTGIAYLYDSGTGSLLRILYNPDALSSDFFGSAAALSGDTALIGSRGSDTGAVNTGLAWIFGPDPLCAGSSPTPTPPPGTPSPTPAPATPTPSVGPSPTPSPAPCCPGDADNSGGNVNANDFLSVQANFGLNNGFDGPGDADCSGGAVNANDFLSVQANFGANCD